MLLQENWITTVSSNYSMTRTNTTGYRGRPVTCYSLEESVALQSVIRRLYPYQLLYKPPRPRTRVTGSAHGVLFVNILSALYLVISYLGSWAIPRHNFEIRGLVDHYDGYLFMQSIYGILFFFLSNYFAPAYSYHIPPLQTLCSCTIVGLKPSLPLLSQPSQRTTTGS